MSWPCRHCHCREFGYWHNDPEQYYSTGRYLTYDTHVVEFIQRYNSEVFGGRMTRYHRNHLAQVGPSLTQQLKN